MPLNSRDRKFLQTVDRLKMLLLFMAISVLLFLLLAPSSEIHVATSVLGIALCGLFWLTQRLLTFVTLLDRELTRVVNAVKHSLPEAQRKELFP